jgi:hypothetical protein
MERKTVKKLGMLLRVLNSKKFRTAKRGKKLEKVEALAAKRIEETKKIIDAKLVELGKAQEEMAALNDLKDICDHLGDYSKENIGGRVQNLMSFFGIPQPGEGAPRKKKVKPAGTPAKAAEAKPAAPKPAAAPQAKAPEHKK